MVRDYWIYQRQEVEDPWAAHIWVTGKYINLAFYAEWVRGKAKHKTNIGLSLQALLDAIGKITAKSGRELTADDIQQFEEEWARIASENKLS